MTRPLPIVCESPRRFPRQRAGGMRRVASLGATLVVALNVVACHAPSGAPPTAAPSELVDSERRVDHLARELQARGSNEPVTLAAIGRSVHGKPLLLHEFPGAGPHVVLLATIHGDEFAGTPLLERLVAELRAHRELARGRRVSVLPVVNPDGLQARRRENARGVDLNRNFPSRNAQESVGGTPLSEPESRALHGWLLTSRADLVISIHQPVAVVDWDGPADEIARIMSEASGLPAQRIGSRPGSLGSFLGVDNGVPVITLELPGGAQRLSPDVLWERYGATLLRAIESAESQRSSFS
ncbi:MAG: hypothetical protein DHS20C15_33210 [Planctomycetota bacterium]|nr:MAG: hypothetical protein DHS20C15_33210 [Planctomycetota bacterium]